jgi:ABC-type antimicrobial peptide transport system permease subunit
MDPEMVTVPQTMRAVVEDWASRLKLFVDVVLFLGAVAVLLAVVGIYGVVAFAVSQRRKELGIRMALGATKTGIVRAVLASGVKPVLAGIAAGILAALAGSALLSKVMQGAPFSLEAQDPFIFGGSALLLASVALAAMFDPALRAASSDPVQALRQD